MLRKLYDKVMALSGSRHATPWLAVISFAESSFFPIPPDVMLAPMVLARPERAWKLAAVCTLASVLGGCLGYAIGFYFADFGLKILALFGHASSLAEFRAWYDKFGLAVILVKGLTPIPYKLVTIASGLAAFSFPVFIVASVVTRGARFFLVAGLLKYFGPQVREMVEKRLALATAIGVALLVAVYAVMHYLEMIMRILRPFLDRWPLVAALASALMLAIAHAFETFGGLAPCTLCYRQREVYWAALGVAVAGMALMRLWRDRRGRMALCLLLGAVFLYGAGLAAYHAGAEWKWWPGPTTCSGGGGGVSMDAMNDLLAGKTIHGPACDKAAWVFLGLSMAGWNALISLKLAIYSVWAGLRAAKAAS